MVFSGLGATRGVVAPDLTPSKGTYEAFQSYGRKCRSPAYFLNTFSFRSCMSGDKCDDLSGWNRMLHFLKA